MKAIIIWFDVKLVWQLVLWLGIVGTFPSYSVKTLEMMKMLATTV